MLLRVAFEGGLPVGRFGPLFHVLCMEEPAARLEWTAVGFPTLSGALLDGADVGLFTSPPVTEGLSAMTLDESPMFVAMAVGHPLARRGEVRVADILDEPFPAGPDLQPDWRAFWTLDAARGGPPRRRGGGGGAAEALRRGGCERRGRTRARRVGPRDRHRRGMGTGRAGASGRDRRPVGRRPSRR